MYIKLLNTDKIILVQFFYIWLSFWQKQTKNIYPKWEQNVAKFRWYKKEEIKLHSHVAHHLLALFAGSKKKHEQ